MFTATRSGGYWTMSKTGLATAEEAWQWIRDNQLCEQCKRTQAVRDELWPAGCLPSACEQEWEVIETGEAK